MAIAIDFGERTSGVPKALDDLGAEIVFRRLAVGDYEVAQHAIVERKTISDLHRSVIDRRIWRQLSRATRTGRDVYLLVEGSRTTGPLSANALVAVLLAASESVRVLRTSTPMETARYLSVLHDPGARPRITARVDYRRKRRLPAVTNAELILTAIPGISFVSARVLLREFGSLAAVFDASRDELLRTVGIGEARVAALDRILHAPWERAS